MNSDLCTVQELAEDMGITDSRVRAICRKYGIGRVIGRDRLLTKRDVACIKNRRYRKIAKSSKKISSSG